MHKHSTKRHSPAEPQPKKGPITFTFTITSTTTATSAGAILDACKALKLADPDQLQKGGQLIERVVSMLTKIIKF
jgi:hypothetical protein